MVAKKKKAKK